jgi:hypothetical protein
MTLRGHRLQRGAGVAFSLVLLLFALVAQASQASPARAATTQFRGVNWADPNDNFITGPNVPVGLSTADDYSTAYAKSTAILKGFQGLGANTVRMGMNAATTSAGCGTLAGARPGRHPAAEWCVVLGSPLPSTLS